MNIKRRRIWFVGDAETGEIGKLDPGEHRLHYVVANPFRASRFLIFGDLKSLYINSLIVHHSEQFLTVPARIPASQLHGERISLDTAERGQRISLVVVTEDLIARLQLGIEGNEAS